ncbi:hypothetical protein BKA64DRAFT_710037 [Cadophora sp. MPI-SDFR-AT-0126]|nr:hypothetical protein BKA64DRAFT_710037 [Leotiomycetes sp. MPI-SDFR-AT-0126]
MAPTETTAKPKQPESSKVDDKTETAQNPSTDPATTGHLQQTVSKASELTDPAMEETLRVASPSWNDLPVKLFKPEPFAGERKK